MRGVADAERIQRFMQVLGREAGVEARVYFTEGATAVLFGWRASTIDIDMKAVPEDDRILLAIPQIKDSLRINVDLASPEDFIPVPPGWEDRSPFIAQVGKLTFHHFDLYAQALAKAERSHTQNLEDVREMILRRLIKPARALEYFNAIEERLYRYPAIDPQAFRAAVEEVFGSGETT